MDPERILEKVCRSLDILAAVGERYDGLFPSLLDLTTHEMLTYIPPEIHGQRDGDRAHQGSNLIHDQAALRTMYALGAALARHDYVEAADRYLKRFAVHCTDTVTGLFPWGEHAFWHLTEDRLGDGRLFSIPDLTGSAIHDHLRQAPVWLWEKLHEFNPACVQRFAEGLDYHWMDDERSEYNRHAHLEDRQRPEWWFRSCDFPRHGGFYMLDWAFAFRQSGRGEFLEQIRCMADYWWPRRDDNNMLPVESRTPGEGEPHSGYHNVNAPGQTLSLGVSLLEGALLLENREPELAAMMRQRGAAYVDGFLAAPHDLDQGVFALTCRASTYEIIETMPIWGSLYGVWPASYMGLTALCAYRLTGDERLLEWAVAAGRAYLREPMPDGVPVPAMDAGLGLGLLADLYAITGEREWLAGGLGLAKKLLGVYLDTDLPRGAASIAWYESQMGPSFLLHGLARIALLARDRTHCPLDADYTAR